MDRNSPEFRDRVMHFGYTIPGWLWPVEQGWLFDTFKETKHHCEVGCYAGKSLLCSTLGMNDPRTIVAVDSLSGCPMGPDWLRGVLYATVDYIQRFTNAKVQTIEKTSVEAYQVAGKAGVEFDSVFIDADHHYAECKADIEMWSTLVKTGGIIAGHDYWPRDAGVMDAVNETGPFERVPNTRIWYRYKS